MFDFVVEEEEGMNNIFKKISYKYASGKFSWCVWSMGSQLHPPNHQATVYDYSNTENYFFYFGFYKP